MEIISDASIRKRNRIHSSEIGFVDELGDAPLPVTEEPRPAKKQKVDRHVGFPVAWGDPMPKFASHTSNLTRAFVR